MGPALAFLYLQKYKDDELRNSLRQFAQETIDFGIKKVNASEWEENVIQDVIERLQSIELIVGYSEEMIDPKVIEEIFSGLKLGDELNYSKKYREIMKYKYMLERKIESPISRKLIQETHIPEVKFIYSLNENTLCNLVI